MKSLISLVLIAFPLMTSKATLGEVTIHCPDPETVSQQTIPSSINCSYSATSDGVDFAGFNNCGLAGLPFAGAKIIESNGYWGIDCGYSDGQSGNTLSIGPSRAIASCRFVDGNRSCSGSIDECAISCEQVPAKMDIPTMPSGSPE